MLWSFLGKTKLSKADQFSTPQDRPRRLSFAGYLSAWIDCFGIFWLIPPHLFCNAFDTPSKMVLHMMVVRSRRTGDCCDDVALPSCLRELCNAVNGRVLVKFGNETVSGHICGHDINIYQLGCHLGIRFVLLSISFCPGW